MAKKTTTLREKIIDAAAVAGFKKADMSVSAHLPKAIGDGKLLGRFFDFFKALLPILLPIILDDQAATVAEDTEFVNNIRAAATECGLRDNVSVAGIGGTLEKWLKFFLTILPFLTPILDEIGQ